MPFVLPEYVVANELVESSWGNSIVDALAWTERRKGVNRGMAAQVFGGGATTTVSWTSLAEDTDSFVTSATDATVPTGFAGVYGIMFRGTFPSPTAILLPSLWINGVQYASPGIQQPDVHMAMTIPLGAGWAVWATLYNGGAAVTASFAQLTMYRISA